MAKNMDYGCDTFSEHVGKEIKDATGKWSPDVQPYSVISPNVLTYLTQQQDKLFDTSSAGLFGYVLSTPCSTHHHFWLGCPDVLSLVGDPPSRNKRGSPNHI